MMKTLKKAQKEKLKQGLFEKWGAKKAMNAFCKKIKPGTVKVDLAVFDDFEKKAIEACH